MSLSSNMMIFLKLLLSSRLIFIAATASTRNESVCYQKSNNVIPMHYNIKLITYLEENMFRGEYNISINILNKTQSIYLHSEKVCIEDIVLITNFERYHENDKDIVYKSTYNTKEDTIYMYFMDELSPGNYILNIKYFSIADEVFRIFDVKEKTAWVGALHFQIIGALPFFSNGTCLHLHDLWIEAIFNISIKCDLCTTLSNMPLRSTNIDDNDMVWRHYGTTSAMWTEYVTMIVSNYLFLIDIKTRNIKMWCRLERLHMEFAKDVAENSTFFFKISGDIQTIFRW
ncbi:uncharacterized protein LOC114933719 [Nylanderia fulva]|uniref:uncharacterized protein LOC114933719 n=1 Tax=Nylanderia fulva TaxID=613905 RepID=UPI0010FBA25E|nr:uncharacterized protein LOC114933719 [Nylanderia fulva]